MDALLNILKGHAAHLDQGWAHPRIGIVSSVDPKTYTARVQVQPEGLLTGWLPIAALWAGNGWGVTAAPMPGDQVVVIWQEGDAEQGIILGRIWSSAVAPPAAPAGELWLVHASGAFIKLQGDGTISSCAGTWSHQGNLVVSGDVSDSGGKLSALRRYYNQHTHPPNSDAASPLA